MVRALMRKNINLIGSPCRKKCGNPKTFFALRPCQPRLRGWTNYNQPQKFS